VVGNECHAARRAIPDFPLRPVCWLLCPNTIGCPFGIVASSSWFKPTRAPRWYSRLDLSSELVTGCFGLIDLDPLEVHLDESASWRLPEKSLVVDDIRVAHFMSLVRENENIAEVIDAASSKMVLLLGRFTGRQKQVLEALKDALPSDGYAPVVFDFREPADRDLIETVATLAGLAKFIIADLSRPRSTPLESQLTIPQIAIPWASIIR
jgi:hypothetical protein